MKRPLQNSEEASHASCPQNCLVKVSRQSRPQLSRRKTPYQPFNTHYLKIEFGKHRPN